MSKSYNEGDPLIDGFKSNGWYQSRWHMSAGNIYDEGKITAFKNLWQTLKKQKEILDDLPFVALLSNKVHQSVADIQLKWDE